MVGGLGIWGRSSISKEFRSKLPSHALRGGFQPGGQERVRKYDPSSTVQAPNSLPNMTHYKLEFIDSSLQLPQLGWAAPGIHVDLALFVHSDSAA